MTTAMVVISVAWGFFGAGMWETNAPLQWRVLAIGPFGWLLMIAMAIGVGPIILLAVAGEFAGKRLAKRRRQR